MRYYWYQIHQLVHTGVIGLLVSLVHFFGKPQSFTHPLAAPCLIVEWIVLRLTTILDEPTGWVGTNP